MKTICVLCDYGDYEINAIIESDELSADAIQDLIGKMKEDYADYDQEILTEILEENGCSINWNPDVVAW